MEVGVITRMNILMMFMMFTFQFIEREAGVKRRTNLPYSLIEKPTRRYGAMHGIMSSNKQTCIQMHLNQNK